MDCFPNRSPNALHTALLDHFKGKEIVEIGSGKGDAMNCWARVTKRATAIEKGNGPCRILRRRGSDIERRRLGSYKALCGKFPERVVDADIFTWWQMSTKEELSNFETIADLKCMQAEGAIRHTAEAVIMFDKLNINDTNDWEAHSS